MTALLGVAGMPRSNYYYHLKRMKEPNKYAYAEEQILGIYHEHKGRYGYRRITLELRNRGIHLNHKTVQRLMNKLNIKSMVRIKKYRSYRGRVGSIVPNVLQRDFEANRPNAKWVTDITEISLYGSKMYFSPILDLYNGEIISYAISKRPNLNLVIDMLKAGLERLSSGDELILHSDQGWHYQHSYYQHLLKEREVTQSMSRKGNCLDNAVMENFFGIMKSELLYLEKFQSLEHFKEELVKYIDYYNNHRIKSKLKGLSPIQYRTQSLLAA